MYHGINTGYFIRGEIIVCGNTHKLGVTVWGYAPRGKLRSLGPPRLLLVASETNAVHIVRDVVG